MMKYESLLVITLSAVLTGLMAFMFGLLTHDELLMNISYVAAGFGVTASLMVAVIVFRKGR